MIMRKSRGFTLIELLVVLAIIALLASMIIPALGKAKKQARFLICKTNLKAYGQSGNMYLTENDDSFPDERPICRLMPVYRAGRCFAR